MRITVSVPDRIISVDGLHVTFAGAAPDDRVSTLQYDTAVLEGAVTYVDQRTMPLKDPDVIGPWLALWGDTLSARRDAAAQSRAESASAFALWQAAEAQRIAALEELQAKAAVASQEAAARAEADEDERISGKVRAAIAEMAQGR